MLQTINYQLGLLHLMHLLVTSDGHIDEREKSAIDQLQREEKIPHWLLDDFENAISTKSEFEIYMQGVEFLNNCTEDEKLAAFVHLYRLAESDNTVHIREIRFLLYSLKSTEVDFKDVMLIAKMVKSRQAAAA